MVRIIEEQQKNLIGMRFRLPLIIMPSPWLDALTNFARNILSDWTEEVEEWNGYVPPRAYHEHNFNCLDLVL